VGPGATFGTLRAGYPHVEAIRRARRVLAHSHMPHGIGPRIPARGSLGATTRPVVAAPTSRLGAPQVPPRVLWRQLLPPGSGRLGYRHASHGASSCFPALCCSGATTRLVAPAPASQLGAAQAPPHVPWCQLPPPSLGAAVCPTTLCRPRAIKVYEYSPVELLL
jgi:hypothetical protein